jgi:membrane protease YdiL (CAAX protease family)
MTSTAFSITIVCISFLLYHFVSNSMTLPDKFTNRHGAVKGQIRLIFFKRFLGFLLFAFTAVYYLLYSNLPLSSFGIAILGHLSTFYFVLTIGALCFSLNYFAARKPASLTKFPQIRATNWSKSLVLMDVLSWMLYLLGYEIMFRGVLFFSCLTEFGTVTAIVINTAIYSLVHLPKGFKGTVGAIPFGIILCMVTFVTGTIWAAFWIHSIYALTLELMSLRFHPDMKIS